MTTPRQRLAQHAITPTSDGARCSCGREFSVWTTRRGSGWSAAHDVERTRNLVRANAARHAEAQNRKGAVPGERPTPRSRTPVNLIVHSVQVRETGATISVERTGPGSWIEQEPGWVTLCLNHAQLALHDTRRLAVAHAAAPSGWCSDCERIARGQRPKIVERVQ